MKYDLEEKLSFWWMSNYLCWHKSFLVLHFLKEIDKPIAITGLSKHLELRVVILTSFSKYANTQLYHNNLKGTLGLNSFVYHYRHLLLGKSRK